MISTTNVITMIKTREIALKTQLSNAGKKTPTEELAGIEVFSMKLSNMILKSVCNALWMTHLLKTSILVTKTPLTTLKSISKAVINKLSNSIKQLYA